MAEKTKKTASNKPDKKAEKKETQVFDNIFDEAFAKLGEPKNELERDTLNYIRPLVSEMIAQDIVGKGLTLSGCIDHCFGKGHKFEVKKGNRGLARVTEEQHFEWVREYFGIEGAAGAVTPKEPLKLSGENTPRLDLDLDSLFD